MKRFLVVSITLLMMAQSWACGTYETHNSYLFSVIRRDLMTDGGFTTRLDKFWEGYTDGAVDNYNWNKEEILAVAKKKGDTEMINYLNSLNRYLEICEQLQETWKYPTKAELAKRKTDLNNMIAKANSYKGQRLKPQWTLLAMRANMVLGQHTQNINLWKLKASKLPESVYRDMARNIYAGALLHQGQRREACDIYADQGDMISIRWAMRKHRNLAGIKTIMAENPNSATINFLVQDFVNNTQETIDNEGYKEAADFIDSRIILRNEAMNFITYAREVVDKKKTDSPALWLAAIGEIQYLFDMNDEAMATLNKAVAADGTQRMKDNARAIRAVASVKNAKLDENYSQWITNEMKWLVEKTKEESAQMYPESNTFYDNHYYDVLDRLIYNNLAPKYEAQGKPYMSALLIRALEKETLFGKKENVTDTNWNENYSNEFFCKLNEMDANQVLNAYESIKQPTNDPLEKYIKQDYLIDNNFYYDLLGTKFLAEGKFTEALEYLDKVPNKFYENLNVSWYITHRDYTQARWLKHQVADENEMTEGPGLGKVTSNKRADFCREMNALLERYTMANNETRPQIAYDLATRYYQASYWGDCWWLTAYGHSVCDSATVGRPDFVQKAIDYLQQSKASQDPTLRRNSLYGLAFIPQDPWCDVDYDYNASKYIYKPRRNARQYKALAELNTFVQQNSAQMPTYISRCDVLKQFRKLN